MKRLSQTVCLLLVCALILSVPAFATEVSPWASNYFLRHSCYIDEISSTSFEVWFEVTAIRGMDKLGVSEIKIQRSTDRDNWSTVETYSMDDYSNLICEDTGTHSGYVTYSSATSGYYYRAKVTFYAKDGNNTAEYIMYTSSI